MKIIVNTKWKSTGIIHRISVDSVCNNYIGCRCCIVKERFLRRANLPYIGSTWIQMNKMELNTDVSAPSNACTEVLSMKAEIKMKRNKNWCKVFSCGYFSTNLIISRTYTIGLKICFSHNLIKYVEWQLMKIGKFQIESLYFRSKIQYLSAITPASSRL